MTFIEQLHAALHAEPDKPAMEYKGRIFTIGELARLADRTLALLDAADVPRQASIAVVVRNRPLHAAAMLGLISGGRWLTSVYAMQSPEALAEELRSNRFAVVIADEADWSAPVMAMARETGSLGIRLAPDDAQPIALLAGLETVGDQGFRTVEGEPGLEILSSGTTGQPKRIVFPTRMLVRAVDSVRASVSGDVEPDLQVWPYGGIGGMCALVASPILGRYVVLFEKFNVEEWVEAVERLKPHSVSGVPAMARMILDAKIAPERLASVDYFFGGSAAMTPELQKAFEETYGVAVIWAYGATEFCGTVISWTPDLHRAYRDAKAGAMGRALPGVTLRATDMITGEPLPPGAEGFLEALVPVVSDHWIKTTDIVVIDEDGFVFHKGRGDGAILRGGFKVLPEKVVEALRAHPAVLDAAVVGVADTRLTETPVAAVELRGGTARPGEDELLAHARRLLPAPQVPTRVVITDALPRTPSMKVDLRAVKAMFETKTDALA